MHRPIGCIVFVCAVFLWVPKSVQAQGYEEDLSEFMCECLTENNFQSTRLEDRSQVFFLCISQSTTRLSENQREHIAQDAKETSDQEIGMRLLSVTSQACDEHQEAITAMFLYMDKSGDLNSSNINREDARDLVSEADTWIDQGIKLEEALEQLTQVIRAQPDYARAWYHRGRAQLAMERYYEAIGDFYAAIEFGKNQGLYRLGIGYAKVGIGDYGSAIPDLRYAHLAMPTDNELVNELGMAYYQLDQLDSAVFFFKKSMDLNPQSYSNTYNLMYTLAYSGKKNEAMDIVEEAMARFDTVSHGYELRAELYYLLGEYQEAYRDYSQALEKGTNHRKDIIQSMGLCKYELEDYASALTSYNLLIEEFDDLPSDIFLDRGRILTLMEEHKKALRDFNTAISLDQEDANGYYRRGQSYLAMENWKRAERDFDRVLSMAPYYLQAHYERGQARLGRGDTIGACQDFEAATEYDNVPEAVEAFNRYCEEQ
ncbi:MAG TPA: hypothetical protein DCE41_25570 [Cytophagales bacterium]|nr:hypothetical protein [Cytophagales bacterium]HAA19909.1 hypothetical protein [Cytophagales bacterium]